MSEAPERIEREMFEIRSDMASDMTDLRKHVDPQVVAEQVRQNIRQRLQEVINRIKATLRAKRQEFFDSAKHQLSLAREAGEKRDPGPLTDAVKSDPRPFALLVIVLTITLLMARKMIGGRGDQE
jgi:uncharacterized coiled-coil DUF342 family protein